MANGLSVFEQALERSTPGFDSLLNAIQSETNRIERNKQLAQQLEMKEDLLTLQAEKEISVYNATTAPQQQANRDLQRELAALQATAAATESTKEANDELSAAKEEKRKELREQYAKTYKKAFTDYGIFSIPEPEFVAVGNDPNDLQGYYEVQVEGQTSRYTPQEFKQEYGDVLGIIPIIDEFQKWSRDGRLAQSTTEEKVSAGNMTDAAGNVVSADVLGIGQGAIQDEVTKTYLGQDQARALIDQARAGNKNVIRKFLTGEYDLNVIPKGENDIRDTVQTNMLNVMEHLGREADAYPNLWFFGIPGFDWGSGESLAQKSVARIGQELKDETLSIGGKPATQVWNSIIDAYGKLDKGRKAPMSQLYVNPKLFGGNFNEVAVEDFFITKKEWDAQLKNIDMSSIEDDMELTNKKLMQRQSQMFFKSAIKDSTKLNK